MNNHGNPFQNNQYQNNQYQNSQFQNNQFQNNQGVVFVPVTGFIELENRILTTRQQGNVPMGGATAGSQNVQSQAQYGQYFAGQLEYGAAYPNYSMPQAQQFNIPPIWCS